MTEQKLIELSDKINTFFYTELKDESVGNIATAVIFVLAYQATAQSVDFVLPETVCTRALIELNKLTRSV